MAHEHSFATPGPAGLGALAVACFGFGAVFLGLVKPGGLPILAAWLFGGCLVQYTTAVIELKDHNVLGGNVFLFFAAFFMLGAALSTMSKFLLLAGAGAFIPKAAAADEADGASALLAEYRQTGLLLRQHRSFPAWQACLATCAANNSSGSP